MTYQRALDLYYSDWWEKVPAHQAVMRQLKTDRVIMPFEIFSRMMTGFFPGITDKCLAESRPELLAEMETRFGKIKVQVKSFQFV